MNNTMNLVVGYGLAAVLYGGYAILLLKRRRALVTVLSVQSEDQVG